MDWVHSCFASIDCRTRVVKFQFPHETIFELKGEYSISSGQFCKMISKGCIYYIVWVKDVESNTLPLESIQIVWEFPDVFLMNRLPH